MCILVSEKLSSNREHCQFAHDLLTNFVGKSAEWYGKKFSVSTFTVWYTRVVKLSTFVNLKLKSFCLWNFHAATKAWCLVSKKFRYTGSEKIGRKIILCNMSSLVLLSLTCAIENFSCQPPDNNGILEDCRCIQVVSIEKDHVVCMLFTKTEPVYTTPCDSGIIGLHKVRLSNGLLKHFSLNKIAHKCMCYTDNEHWELIFIQQLHIL